MSFAYVGSRTTRERNARGDGITVYRLDAARGQLETVQVVGDLVNPTFLALNRRGDMLYTVNGDRRNFALLRPSGSDSQGQDRIRELILQAFNEFEAQAAVAS